MTKQFSTTYSQAYDLLNTGKPYNLEVSFLNNLYQRFSNKKSPPNSVLDLGCGSGMHLAEFPNSTRKYGIDQSEGMLAKAREREMENFLGTLGDVCSTRILKEIDLVYSLFHVLSYQTSDLGLVNFFISIRDHLTTEGIGVVDFWHRAPWDVDPPITRVTKKSDSKTEVIRISTPNFDMMTGVVEIEMDLFFRDKSHLEFSHLVEQHKMRAYTILELSQAALIAGLKVVATGKWMEIDSDLTSTDWYGWLVCMRIDTEA